VLKMFENKKCKTDLICVKRFAFMHSYRKLFKNAFFFFCINILKPIKHEFCLRFIIPIPPAGIII